MRLRWLLLGAIFALLFLFGCESDSLVDQSDPDLTADQQSWSASDDMYEIRGEKPSFESFTARLQSTPTDYFVIDVALDPGEDPPDPVDDPPEDDPIFDPPEDDPIFDPPEEDDPFNPPGFMSTMRSAPDLHDPPPIDDPNDPIGDPNDPIDDPDLVWPDDFVEDWELERTTPVEDLEQLRAQLNAHPSVQDFFFYDVFGNLKELTDHIRWEQGGLPEATATYSHMFEIARSEEGRLHDYAGDQTIRNELGTDFSDTFFDESSWAHISDFEQIVNEYPELEQLSDHEMLFVFQDYFNALYDTFFDYVDGEGVAWALYTLDGNAMAANHYEALSNCDPENRDDCFEIERERFKDELGKIVGGGSLSLYTCIAALFIPGAGKPLAIGCLGATLVWHGASIAMAFGDYNDSRDQCSEWFGEEGCEDEGDEEGDDRPIAGGGGPIPPWGPSPTPWQPQGPTWIPPAPAPVGGSGGCETHLAEDPENTRQPCRPEDEEDE